MPTPKKRTRYELPAGTAKRWREVQQVLRDAGAYARHAVLRAELSLTAVHWRYIMMDGYEWRETTSLTTQAGLLEMAEILTAIGYEIQGFEIENLERAIQELNADPPTLLVRLRPIGVTRC